MERISLFWELSEFTFDEIFKLSSLFSCNPSLELFERTLSSLLILTTSTITDSNWGLFFSIKLVFTNVLSSSKTIKSISSSSSKLLYSLETWIFSSLSASRTNCFFSSSEASYRAKPSSISISSSDTLVCNSFIFKFCCSIIFFFFVLFKISFSLSIWKIKLSWSDLKFWALVRWNSEFSSFNFACCLIFWRVDFSLCSTLFNSLFIEMSCSLLALSAINSSSEFKLLNDIISCSFLVFSSSSLFDRAIE